MDKAKTENTELEILEAAKQVFQQKGMAGARMQEIADKAKINKALLHYYYRSKQLLFEAVFKNAFSLLAPQINKVLNDDSELFEKIENFTDSYVTFVIDHPYLPNFVIQELHSNPEFFITLRSQKNFPTMEKFSRQVEDSIEKGEIRKIKAEQLLINILSLNIFPFIGQPLVMALLNVEKDQYNEILLERKSEVASFIINSIKLYSVKNNNLYF